MLGGWVNRKQFVALVMLQSLFILSRGGDVIVEKHWAAPIGRGIPAYFWEEVCKEQSPVDAPPIITTPKHYLVHIQRNGLFLLSVLQIEMAPMVIIEWLHRVADVFTEYFDGLNESALKDNHTIVLQLLDEMMDAGLPFTTEPNILKELIRPPTMLNRAVNLVTGDRSLGNVLPDGTMSNVPWRKVGVRYPTNELYLDAVEELDVLLDNNGSIISSDIVGSIECNCRLSGMPDILVLLQNPRLLEDTSFHPCVRFSRWEQNKSISFIPPDGHFELLSYRVHDNRIRLPIVLKCSVKYEEKSAKVEVTLAQSRELRIGKVLEDIKIEIPFPKCVAGAMLSATQGNVAFDEATKLCTWTIGKIKEVKGRLGTPLLSGTATYVAGTEAVPEANPDVNVYFKIANYNLSGFKISKVDISHETYKPFKGVKYVTKAGKFHARC